MSDKSDTSNKIEADKRWLNAIVPEMRRLNVKAFQTVILEDYECCTSCGHTSAFFYVRAARSDVRVGHQPVPENGGPSRSEPELWAPELWVQTVISHIKRTWLHELAHWFFFYYAHTEHRILSDGHEYLCTVCNTCGSERVLVHSSACDRCGS